jgi:hypothetical protein
MKIRPDALGTAENGYGTAKQENWIRLLRYRRKRVWERKTLKLDQASSVPSKSGPREYYMKIRPGHLITAQYKSEGEK